MKRVVSAAVALFALEASAQFCPSYTLSSSGNTGSCAVEAVPGTNPTLAQWQVIFDTVSKGPAAWAMGAPTVSNLGTGCNNPTPPMSQVAKFPCELIKAISMQESSWNQFCSPTTPTDQRGKPPQTIISFDCGYGVGQVTSGMRSFDPMPAYDRSRVASDALYNLQTGMQILTDKWRVTNCVGDNQPRIVEHWYTATWAYNGLSTTNNPNHPNFSTTRGVCRPGSCPSGSAPYQERVWGWMEFPPSANHWRGIRPAYPRLSDIGAGVSRPPALPDPSCATPVSCTNTRAMNVSECLGDGGVVVPPPVDAGRPDAGQGIPDAGSMTGADAGMNVDAGELTDAGPVPTPMPFILQAPPASYPVAKGCGCGSIDGSSLIALAALLTQAARRRGKKQ